MVLLVAVIVRQESAVKGSTASRGKAEALSKRCLSQNEYYLVKSKLSKSCTFLDALICRISVSVLLVSELYVAIPELCFISSFYFCGDFV